MFTMLKVKCDTRDELRKSAQEQGYTLQGLVEIIIRDYLKKRTKTNHIFSKTVTSNVY